MVSKLRFGFLWQTEDKFWIYLLIKSFKHSLFINSILFEFARLIADLVNVEFVTKIPLSNKVPTQERILSSEDNCSLQAN